MRRKMGKSLATGLAALLLAGAMAGCGSSSGNTKETYAADTTASMSEADTMDGGLYASEYGYEAAEAAGGIEESAQEVPDQSGRKLIKTVDMSVETEEFDVLMNTIESRVSQLGGYIEYSNIYNGSYTSNYRSRSANLTARIPAAQIDQFVSEVAEQSNVINKNEYVEDVTLQYVDLESHKKALEAEEESLLAMLEKAESLEDIIAIQSQLTDVRYRLESMESQLRTYDNKVDYSTLTLYVEEVAQYEPYVPKSAGERISEGFINNVHNVADGIQNFLIEFIIALPLLLTAAVIIGIGIAVVYAIIRVSEKRAQKKKKEREAKPDGSKQA